MPTTQIITNGAALRRAASIATGFVIALVAGDWLLAEIKLPRVYGSTNECRWKCELYQATRPTPDVVFIGSSYEFYGISPSIIDAQATALLGREVTSLNLASSAASLLTESLTVRRMLESGPPPRVAYLGISPRGAATTRREWLIWGMRGLGDVRDLPLTLTSDAALLWEAARMATLRSNFQINDLQLMMQHALVGAPLTPASKTLHDSRGWAQWIGGDRRDLPAWDVARGEQAWGVDGPAFAPDNINGRALRRAVADLRSAGLSVRLLEMPISRAARAASDAQASAYAEFVAAAVADTGVRLVRIPEDLVPEEHFFDHLHLDPAGAELVSRWLAEEVAAVLRNGAPDEAAHVASAGAQTREVRAGR